MANQLYLPIAKFLGWKLSDDKATVMVGFQHPEGPEFAIGFPRIVLAEVITNLINATDAFPASEGTAVRELPAMAATRFQFGKDEGSDDFFLTLRLMKGGYVPFVMDRSMAEQLTETLNAQVMGVASGPPPGTRKN